MQLNLYHARPVRVTDRDGAFFSGTAHFVPGTDGGQDALRVDQALIPVDRIAAVKTDRMDKPKDPQRMKKVSVETFGEVYPEPEKM